MPTNRQLLHTTAWNKPFRSPKAYGKFCYRKSSVGFGLWEVSETTQIRPIEDDARANVVDEIVRKRGIFNHD